MKSPKRQINSSFFSSSSKKYDKRFSHSILYLNLSESSVDAMFTNQIGKLDVEKITSQNQEISNDADMSFGSTAKWGLGFLLHPQGTQNGRSPGSASWAGMFNTYFWIDRRKSLFGMFATQVLPFYDTKSIEYLKKFEKSVYEIL